MLLSISFSSLFPLRLSLEETNEGPTNPHSSNELSKRTAGFAIACIFTISVLALGVVFANFPEMNELVEKLKCEQDDIFFVCREDLARFRYPTDLDTAKDLGRVLSKYKDTHYNTVLIAVVVTYVLYPFSNVCSSGYMHIYHHCCDRMKHCSLTRERISNNVTG